MRTTLPAITSILLVSGRGVETHSARSFISLFLPVIAGFVLTACGEGGGGGDPTPPSISNLQYGPATVYLNEGGGTVMISGTVDFQDTGGDVTTARFISSAGADLVIPVSGMAGSASGTIQGSFTVGTTTLGDYTFDVWIVDANGSNSNHLSGTYSVHYDTSARNWTPQASGTGATLRRVTWTGSKFIAVGDSGTVVTSPDGITWTGHLSQTTNHLFGVATSGSLIVAVGTNGTILTSGDGVSWEVQNSAVGSNLYSVIWGGGQFVATGASDILGWRSDAPVLTSPDGVTWTKQTSGLVAWDLRNIAWSGTEYVVVGAAHYNPADNVVLTSTDGVAWSQHKVTFSNGAQYLLDVAWSGANFVAVGPPYAVATSADGITWQPAAADNTSLLHAVTWNSYGHNFVAVGGDVNTSPDGSTWTRTVPVSSWLRGIVWGANKYVAVGDAGQIMTSP